MFQIHKIYQQIKIEFMLGSIYSFIQKIYKIDSKYKKYKYEYEMPRLYDYTFIYLNDNRMVDFKVKEENE